MHLPAMKKRDLINRHWFCKEKQFGSKMCGKVENPTVALSHS